MKTTETPAPVPAESGATVSKVDTPARPQPKPKKEGKVLNVFSHGFLVLWAFMVVMPLLWAVMTSFKDDSAIFSSPWSLPDKLHFDNWARAWTDANMSDYFLNTILVVGGSLIGTLVLGSMAAYVLARFDFPGNRFIYFLFIGGMSFPIMLALVPLFYVVNNMGLLNSIHGLILVYIAYSLPFTVFFLHAFFRTLPTSVAEAAFVDGASHSRTFFQIMLPMARPGMASVAIFNFLGLWNQFLLPIALNTNSANYVLSQGMASFASQAGYAVNFGALFAAVVITVVPGLIVYLIFQRRLEGSVSQGTFR